MIVVGLNSYITVSEADELLQGDVLYEKFSALTTEQKEKLLADAAMRIDALPLSGRKKALCSTWSFPEVIRTKYRIR